MNKKYKIALIIILSLIVVCSFIIPYTSSKYIETKNQSFLLNIFEPKYTIIFNANTGSGSMSPQTFTYSESKALTANAFTKDNGYSFMKWTTNADGTGTSYNNKQVVSKLSEVDGAQINLYAQWVQGVAKIGDTVYNSLQAAINAVPTNNTETVVELLTDVKENLTVAANKNITLELNNHTITNNTHVSVFKNSGTIRMSNGTIVQTAQNESAFDNSSTAKFYMSGGSIQMTNKNGKQAIYNNGGEVVISGTAYLSAVGNQSAQNQQRPCVHNLNNGKLTITGGTIVSTNLNAVQNDLGTLVIGIKDGTSDNTTPVIQGGKYGINSTPGYSFYDGIIKGKTNAVNNESLITDKETNYSIIHSIEVIDGYNYQAISLGGDFKTVTFNPNGGTINPNTMNVLTGNPIGTLPIPIRDGFDFDGWFTDPTSGTQIYESTIINDDVTYYAHWTSNAAFVVNGQPYGTLKSAVAAIPANNVQTTITMTKDFTSTELTTINVGQNIIFDFGNYTISHSGNDAIVENKGTLSVVSGTLTTSGNAATINNNSNASLTISGGNVISTGEKQAVYNFGNVTITGNAYLKSSTTGKPTQYTTITRGTLQNLPGSSATITGGTIICDTQQAISSDSTVTFGSNDGTINTSSPVIIGETSGIVSKGAINFYDGIIKGKTTVIDGTVSSLEANSEIVYGTEGAYNTAYLSIIDNPEP